MATEASQRLRDWGADTVIVLGSGLNALIRTAPSDKRISYSELPELPPTSVPGHAGQFVMGTAGDRRVIYAQGRVHLYEGHSAATVTAGIRFLAKEGFRRIILTNAAGTTNSDFKPGSWMMISDHLNLTGTTPLLGTSSFIDLSEVYSRKWRRDFATAARSIGMTLHTGVYAGLLGPQYETPAEVRMLRGLGADAIGMSTVLEAIQARALGMEVAGFSCLTNWAAGIAGSHLNHEEVLATGKAAAKEFGRLLATCS